MQTGNIRKDKAYWNKEVQGVALNLNDFYSSKESASKAANLMALTSPC
jgi:hypothetical protein